MVKFGSENDKVVGNGTERSSYIEKLSQEEIDDRKRKGLCFNCHEQYTYGHRYKKLFVIMMNGEMLPIMLSDDTGEENNEGEVRTYAHVVGSFDVANTIKVRGRVKNVSLIILIDSGSAHNFLDPQAAKKINCVGVK